MKTGKQNTCEGCLPVCLLLLTNEKITLKSELELLIEGFKRNRESYSLGIVREFAFRYDKILNVFVHTKYFFKKLGKINKSPRIQLIHKKIGLRFLKELQTPYVLYLDDRILRKSIHYPHFVIVERKQNKKFVLLDPWDGKRKWLTEGKLLKGVLSLKNYLKFCPLVIKLD